MRCGLAALALAASLGCGSDGPTAPTGAADQLGDVIVSRWGRSAFRRLIETNAGLPGVIGMSAAEFEAAWQAGIRDRYFS